MEQGHQEHGDEEKQDDLSPARLAALCTSNERNTYTQTDRETAPKCTPNEDTHRRTGRPTRRILASSLRTTRWPDRDCPRSTTQGSCCQRRRWHCTPHSSRAGTAARRFRPWLAATSRNRAARPARGRCHSWRRAPGKACTCAAQKTKTLRTRTGSSRRPRLSRLTHSQTDKLGIRADCASTH